MTSFIRILAGSVITILVAHVALGAEAPQFSLRTGDLAARLSPADGRLLSLAVRGHELLAAPSQLFVQVNKQEAVPLIPNGPVCRSSVRGQACASRGGNRDRGSRLARYGLPARISNAVRRSSSAGRSGLRRRLNSRSPVSPVAWCDWRLPAQEATVVDFTRRLGTGYRGDVDGMVMPATIFYQPEEDWGLTVFADFALPTRGFEVWTDVKPARITVRRVHLRLEPGRPVEVSLILFGHAGDWRPGLGHVVQRYPQFFRVADPRIPALHGPFVCSGGTPTDQTLDQWQTQHVQTVEVHGTLPFYGQHLPLGDSWPAFADDQWHGLKQLPDPAKPREDASWKAIHDYVCRKSPERISAAQINDYIRRLHAHGMFALMYFNPTESWKPWIMENYPEALAKGPTGEGYPTWYESWIVCPEPESRWGRHLLNEFQRMMELYPGADGFFMDQVVLRPPRLRARRRLDDSEWADRVSPGLGDRAAQPGMPQAGQGAGQVSSGGTAPTAPILPISRKG